MKLRRALGYAALGIGAAVAGDELLRREAGDLDPALSGMQRTFRWRGMNVAYTEAGDADDPTLVLLHGVNAAGSSGEFREVFQRLSRTYHVVAPDLPGFGRSERPPLRYSAALYEDFVTDFLAEFADETGASEVDEMAGERGPEVVASSLTAAYAVAAAQRTPVTRLTLVCPTAVAGPEPPKGWLRELLRMPVVGQVTFDALASRPAIRYFNADHGYADPESVSEEWMDYEWRTAHQENARFAPASFVAGHLNSDLDLAAALADLDVPTSILWGREADITPVSDGRALAHEADVEFVVFDHAKLLPHVERAGSFLDYVLNGDLPKDDSVLREYAPGASDGDRADAAAPAADTDAAASTESLVDEAEAQAEPEGRAEPGEAAASPTDEREAAPSGVDGDDDVATVDPDESEGVGDEAASDDG